MTEEDIYFPRFQDQFLYSGKILIMISNFPYFFLQFQNNIS